MSRVKRMALIIAGLIVLVLVGLFFFVFNPLGLGPEPAVVLSQDFFEAPAQDLSQLELLVNGEAAFTEILSAIDEARTSIHVQTYIWKDDQIGRRVVDKLKHAADRTVSVTVRKDVLGTFFEIGDILKGKPSPVYTAVGLRNYTNIDVVTDVFADTDHSKYFIIDRQIAIFGGMNIADEYHKKWHDYMVAIRSARWAEVFAQKAIHAAPWPAPAPFVVTVNNRKATEIRTALIQVIDGAAEQLIIEHAYFSDNKVIAAVKRAAQRGVAVAVILPERPDTHLYANRVTINKLLGAGAEAAPQIYLYPRMSHAKVVLVDGVIASVGSANLTPRSMVTSKELTLFAHGRKDDPFIQTLQRQLTQDIRQCRRVDKPFKLSFIETIMAVAGKYIW